MNPLEELQLPDTLVAELRAAYASPPRAYHNFAHVLEVLGHFARVPHWDDRDSVALAILFHDAIYVAGRADNEAASAAFARAQLRGTAWAGKIERVCELVLLTARHGALHGEGLDRDTRQFLDCDMAILGVDPGAYDVYERAIAEEYASVPPELYRAGRARFLEKLLQSPRIFLSDFFFAEREAKAHENLRRASSALTANHPA